MCSSMQVQEGRYQGYCALHSSMVVYVCVPCVPNLAVHAKRYQRSSQRDYGNSIHNHSREAPTLLERAWARIGDLRPCTGDWVPGHRRVWLGDQPSLSGPLSRRVARTGLRCAYFTARGRRRPRDRRARPGRTSFSVVRRLGNAFSHWRLTVTLGENIQEASQFRRLRRLTGSVPYLAKIACNLYYRSSIHVIRLATTAIILYCWYRCWCCCIFVVWVPEPGFVGLGV